MDVVLAIETSNPSAAGGESGPAVVVARYEERSTTEVARASLDPARPHDEQLVPAIARAVRAAGLRPADLSCVAVSIGPGGFTAVRVAVAAAKMIAEVTGARCVGVPSAMVAARRVHAPGPFLVALACKGESFYAVPFSSPQATPGPGVIMTSGELRAAAVTLLIADAFFPADARAAAAQLGITVQPPVFDALACAECARALPACDPVALLPIYPREPEAVTKWRERANSSPRNA
ncbi:MAG: tRNA (adenosine(37)-N6)-threonylcarbamoyltransferase complex dimerization subunit type 1 TsaB [Leptolyngbya sp. PLA1]|nr:tRNA (adenosine(37)-N6)-threonylcarbamoyltransferase complex dimerization subunit type 1 TsaB [Leptolyngbya sp. PLA1]